MDNYGFKSGGIVTDSSSYDNCTVNSSASMTVVIGKTQLRELKKMFFELGLYCKKTPRKSTTLKSIKKRALK